jgi:glycosyltransferase involved in cell wall biosynthesis
VTGTSVIVPVRNAAGTLERCLDAILAQEPPAGGYEVIVIDNNSTDRSAALAQRYAAARCLAEPRQSAYAARNCGVRAAAGRLLAFTDPDCVPRRDWLLRLTEAMADPGAMVVTGRDRPTGRTLAVRLLGEYDHVKEACVMEGDDPSAYYAHTNNLITRREVFDRVGPFDEGARGGDVVFVHRVLALYGTAAVRYEPGAHVDHLEVASAPVYFRKAFLYGRSARRYVRVVRARPLRNAERVHIYRETVRRCSLSAAQSTLLLLLLGVGVGFYQLGWWAGGSGRDRAPGDSRELVP